LNIAIDVSGTTADGLFLGWAPRPAKVTLSNIPAGSGPISVELSNSGSKGSLLFTGDRTVRGTSSLILTVEPGVAEGAFFVAGEFGFPSAAKDDAAITASVIAANPPVEVTQPLTVRVRKNANKMTAQEVDRFLFALAQVNDQGRGPFQAIRDMHRTSPALVQAHTSQTFGGAHFLPWHRAYLLDLERHLQSFDKTVFLPYWKFDEPAPGVFKPSFMGSTDNSGQVNLADTNPLIAWRTEGGRGIIRFATFNERTESPLDLQMVFAQSDVLNFGGTGREYAGLTHRNNGIERLSHNGAHGSFEFDLGDPATAPRDPIFFLLHCNVDRLWAHWQWLWNRSNKTGVSTYPLQGKSPQPDNVGRLTLDTMWPWDGVVNGQRPSTVPRAGLPDSPTHAAPGPAPAVASMIDYQGKLDPTDDLGFDYDDVPFWN
jgi:tyrosinase